MNIGNFEDIIGSNIRRERNAKGWSQTELGKKCGISNTTISSFENNKKTPGLDNIIKIARALEVSLDRLCFGENEEVLINMPDNDGRKIVNCVKYLYEKQILAIEQFPFNGELKDVCCIHRCTEAIVRLMNTLEDYEKRIDSFSDAKAFCEMIMDSAAYDVNKELKEKYNMD